LGKGKDKRKAKKKAEKRMEKEARASFHRAHQIVATVILAKELGSIMRREHDRPKTDAHKSPDPSPAK
jgi:hypothetical protein